MKHPIKSLAVTIRFVMLTFAFIIWPGTHLTAFSQSDGITIFDHLPPGRPDTKKPTDKDLIFYIQRSMNRNTVVYVARRDASGRLHRQNPIAVFWRRFASDGKTSRLTYLERTMAFGVDTQKAKNKNGEFWANLVSYPARKGLLKLDNHNRPVVLTTIAKHKVRLISAFIQLKAKSTFPQIVYVDVIGQDVTSGKYIRRRVYSPQKDRWSGSSTR